MVAKMKVEFADLKMTYSIGGQISFDVFPQGWDKTFCLRYLAEADFDEIHFFGDKCARAAAAPRIRAPQAEPAPLATAGTSRAATTSRSTATRAPRATPSRTPTR